MDGAVYNANGRPNKRNNKLKCACKNDNRDISQCFFFIKALLGNDLICNQHENKLKIWCDKTCVSLAFKNYLNYCICYFVRLL